MKIMKAWIDRNIARIVITTIAVAAILFAAIIYFMPRTLDRLVSVEVQLGMMGYFEVEEDVYHRYPLNLHPVVYVNEGSIEELSFDGEVVGYAVNDGVIVGTIPVGYGVICEPTSATEDVSQVLESFSGAMRAYETGEGTINKFGATKWSNDDLHCSLSSVP